MAGGITREEAKDWWLRCISCSETSVTLVNRDAGISEPLFEQALHLFSGGFMHQGHACGHLWGATLSAGIRAAGKFEQTDIASAAALAATIRLAGALSQDGWSFSCRQNTGYDFTTLSGRLGYLNSDKPKACGRKALAWASQANSNIDEALAHFDPRSVPAPCANCAAKCMEKIAPRIGFGGEGSTIVAGFAGGLGLTGNVCAALSVGIFALSINHYRDRNPEKRDSQLRAALQELNLVKTGLRKVPLELLRDFKTRFGSEHCREIAAVPFADISDHSHYITSGGCIDVIEFVVDWLGARIPEKSDATR